jgi:hypothetical protein
VAAAALALAALVWWIERSLPGEPGLLVILFVGGLGGWFSAFGGAWKDAPIEGFETLKFFRSPVIATLYALILSMFTDNLFVIPLAALGYTIATLETYKTFFFPSKPRGKFSGKPVTHPEMLTRRNRFVPVYVGIWIAVAAVLAMGLSS